MEKLKILMAIDKFSFCNPGGAGTIFYEWARGLASRGHQVYLIFQRIDKELICMEPAENIHILSYKNNFKNPLLFLLAALLNNRRLFNKALRENRIDVANFHHPVPAVGASLSSLFGRVHKVYTFHASWSEEYKIRRKKEGPGFLLRKQIERRALHRCDSAVVLSNYSRQKISALHNFPPSKVKIVPGGVDTERFSPAASKETVRRQLGLSTDKFILLSIRRLVPSMGLDNLIRAIALVVKKAEDVMLIIGGRGQLEADLKDLVRELCLESYVHFLGFVKDGDLPLYYQAADLFILPTIALEGFGLVSIEALACGTPVLGTPVGGTREILPRLDEELLFKGTEPEAIAERINHYLSHKEEIVELAHKSHGFVQDNYSWDSIIPGLEKIFLQARGRNV